MGKCNFLSSDISETLQRIRSAGRSREAVRYRAAFAVILFGQGASCSYLSRLLGRTRVCIRNYRKNHAQDIVADSRYKEVYNEVLVYLRSLES